MAFIAYYFNWDHADILELPHWERQRWCDEISEINDQLNGDEGGSESLLEPTLENLLP